MKFCKKCQSSKPESAFGSWKVTKDGLHTFCRDCVNKAQREVTKAVKSQRYRKNSQLKKKFGITLERYESILSSQQGKCAICGTDKPGGRGGFHVDHCHKTGKIRGLLCSRCNWRVLGLLESGVVEKAVAYLKKHGS